MRDVKPQNSLQRRQNSRHVCNHTVTTVTESLKSHLLSCCFFRMKRDGATNIIIDSVPAHLSNSYSLVLSQLMGFFQQEYTPVWAQCKSAAEGCAGRTYIRASLEDRLAYAGWVCLLSTL